YMLKFMSKHEKNWGVKTNLRNGNGKPIYGTDGKLQKTNIRMENAQFTDGMPQPLCFETGSNRGLFKGMAVILEEQGLTEAAKLCAECKKFKCLKPTDGSVANCCCRRVLYNQPDFIAVESLLETTCKAREFTVIFLPKFHCELNFIEQCWGYTMMSPMALCSRIFALSHH
ncbi:hypothetical protein PILCRDRAFT_77971, partial [Piloderma croceum F 1598]